MSTYFTKENLINNSMCGESIWYFSFLMGVRSLVNFYLPPVWLVGRVAQSV